MAKYNLNNYTDKDGIGFPLNFRRGNPNPLDNSSVWDSYSSMEAYAQTDATAYVGQVLSLVETVDETTVVTVYSIQDEAGNLKRVGTFPVGDEGTITVTEDGKVSLYGIDTLTLEREDEDGNKTPITYQPLYVNGKLTWVEPSATTIEDLSAAIAGLDVRLTAVETTVGDAESGLVKAVADNTTAIGEEAAARQEGDEANANAIDDINAKIGDVAEDKTVVGMIDDAVKAASDANTTLENKLTDADTGLSNRIGAIEADYLKDADRYDDTTLSNRVGAIEADYLKDADRYDDTALAKRVTDAEAAIDAIEADYLKEADKYDDTALSNRIGTVEADYLKEADKTTLQDNIDDKADKTYVEELEGTVGDMDAAYKAADVELQKAIDTKAAQTTVDGIETRVKSLEDVESEKNVIASVDEEQFKVDADRKLSLLDVAISKVTGLQDELDSKVDKIEGHRLITSDESTKLDKITLNEDGPADIDALVEVEKVKDLDEWVETNRNTVPGLLSESEAAIIANVANVEAGAEVNDIVAIKVAGSETALPITDRVVDIPAATNENSGVVLGSLAENKVSVASDKTMEVNSLNVNKLTQTTNDYIILNGGSATTVI